MPDIEWNIAMHSLGLNRERLQIWGTNMADPWVRQRIESLVTDHDACLYAFEHATRMVELLPRLQRRRWAAQRIADLHNLAAPPRWRFRQRQAWEDRRRVRWGRFRRALRAEQEAMSATPQAVHGALVSRARSLSVATDAVEAALREVASTEVVIRDGMKSTREPPPFKPKSTRTH